MTINQKYHTDYNKHVFELMDGAGATADLLDALAALRDRAVACEVPLFTDVFNIHAAKFNVSKSLLSWTLHCSL